MEYNVADSISRLADAN